MRRLWLVPPDNPAASPAYQQFCLAIRECERDLHVRALSLTRNPADARDLTQRTLERGLRSLHRFEAGTNIRQWLLRILLNLFLDDCRRSARAPRLEPLDDHPASTPSIEETIEDEPPWARVTPEQFQAALLALGPLFRQVYELRIVQKLKYQEIADRLQIPVATVGTRLQRARTHLHALLVPPGGLPGRQGQGNEGDERR
jgi:RNA polymerase sigma-70 factor (ECF subfamily)